MTYRRFYTITGLLLMGSAAQLTAAERCQPTPVSAAIGTTSSSMISPDLSGSLD